MIGRDAMNLNLRAALDVRYKRHEVLAHNLANADTPGFIPKDLAFEGALTDAMEGGLGAVPMARPDGLAMGGFASGGEAPRMSTEAASALGSDPAAAEMVERPEVGDTIDGNAVDTDKEMARVADNSLYYQTQLELLRRRYAAVQKVITGMSGV